MTARERMVRADEVKVGDRLAGRFGAEDLEVVKVGRGRRGDVQLQLKHARGARPIFAPDAKVRLRA